MKSFKKVMAGMLMGIMVIGMLTKVLKHRHGRCQCKL